MTTLRLPGQAVPNDTRDVAALGEYLDVEVLATQEVIGVVRGEPLKTADLSGAKDDDVIELQFDGGVTQWTTVAQLKEEGRVARGGDGDDVLHVPVQFSRGTTQRGFWDWVLRGVRVLRIDPAGKLADLGQAELVDRFESQQQPPPALYRVGEKGALANPVTTANPLPGGPAPWLIFIHGTASSTDGSYGKLFDTQEFRDLRTKYGDRILALQHKTFSVSPATNAIDLATLLPADAAVHLVTHSRGGLIGELLCIQDFDDASLDVFRKAGRDTDVAQFKKLRGLLKTKKLIVEKFVRVACPARGTILASRRLDLYFSVILNLLGMLMPGNPLYALFKATALALIKRRTMADQLPGLEAMMPESPFVHFLNKGLATKADLGVIAGDVEGDTFLTRLKAFATDIYYLQEHDLVVNTSAMFGGMGRPSGAYGFYDKGSSVNHFSYFGNAKTRARLYGWLTAPKGTPDPAFQKFDPRVGGIPIAPARAARAAIDTTRPAIVIVPDVFGTLLERNGEVLWLDVAAIARHGLDALGAGNALRPATLVDKVYGPLAAGLAGAADVEPFAYDWRQSLEDSAAELAALLRTLPNPEVHIVAHGSGGLLVRALLTRQTAVWNALTEKRGRALLLGAPLGGMFAAVQWCSGRSRLARMLALADGSSPADVAAWFRTLPGIVELVPDRYLDAAEWQKDGIPPPDAALLARAKALRDDASGPLPANVLPVVGRDATTPTPVAFDPDPLNVRITREGDGRVTLDSAAPSAPEAWRVEAPHGELPMYAGAFTAYLELLRTGQTARLRIPHGAAGAAESVRDEANVPLLFPTSEDLAAEAFLLRVSGEARRDYPLSLSVTHGDLRLVRHPVMVGHYQGDPIVSAEAVLDRRLNRRLSRRFQMGLYPGPAGTVEVIRAPKSAPPGALIIGLGHVGSVTPEIIRRGVAAAALRHALQVAEEDDGGESTAAGWRSAAISTVLLGTNGGNAISIEESIAAILRGVLDANRSLRRQDQWKAVRIDAIEFVELFEQRAIESVYAAKRAAARLNAQFEAGEHVDVNPMLRPTTPPSGKYTRPPSASQTGWWQRMFITAAEEADTSSAALKYVVIAERARAEATLQCREQNLTQLLIEGAVQKPGFDPGLSGALFELLVPNDIKTAAADVPNVVITLDHAAAQIPWEILSDPTAPREEQPFSVKTGLLRQLVEGDFRGNPRPSELRTALVVGDTTSGFAKLPGAEEEAEAVAKVIGESQFTVTHLRRPEPTAFITELFARPYRILHIAAHGAYNGKNPAESGVVLDGPRGIYLSACQLRQLRTVPDFVFINCCFLGAIDREPRPHLLAASVAEELIKMGVRAVIAAGWAVDDAAGVTFASSFYDAMLNQRRSFGDAVRWARAEVFTKHPSTNTWAAYQCYGNPGFLLTAIGDGATSGASDDYCTAGEYVDAIRSLEAVAGVPEDLDWARESLAQFGSRLPESWRDGELLARLGYAWRAAGDLDAAIQNFQAALEHEEATAPIHAAERLWDVVCRRAAELHDADGDPARVRELVTQAEGLRKWLTVLPSTAHRLNLQGKNYRRLARIAGSRAEADALLREAADAFRKSAALRPSPNDGSGLYSRRNALFVDWLLNRNRAAVSRELDEIEPVVQANAGTGAFWDRAGVPDLELLRGLMAGRVDAERIAGLYRGTLTANDGEREQKAPGEFVTWILDELKRRRHAIPPGLQDLVAMLTGAPLPKRPSPPRAKRAARPSRKRRG